jgi:hypothetical protein
VANQELGGSVVEPGIELVNDWFVTNNWEDSDQSRNRTYQKQDGDPDGWPPFFDKRLSGDCFILHIFLYDLKYYFTVV